MSIEIKNQQYYIDGKPQFLVSGEFHYFRVPREDWRSRLIALKEMGGNCIATYVPWLVHEPEEGNIQWAGTPNNDLTAFLDLCAELSINVILRPGPLQYAELRDYGLPGWLFDKYPEIQAQRIDGSVFYRVPSYMHPLFLEKTRKYFKEFSKIAKKYMSKNGGPVFMLQVDNELTGIHIWWDTFDYNPQTNEFGKENGRYSRFLKEKYKSLDVLNERYGGTYTSFGEILPSHKSENAEFDRRRGKDYFEYYIETCSEYLKILANWLREDGLEEYICHNSANQSMNGLFDRVVDKMGENFTLGCDHYYCLDRSWAQNNPTPQYVLNVLYSTEQMYNMGMVPTVMEMPAGSMSDTPPIVEEDLYACYMINIALGIRGLNYYIFTGGPNYGNIGSTCDVYDYHAFIHANGEINNTYYAGQKFGKFLCENSWLQSARRVTTVNVAYENEWSRCEFYGLTDAVESQYDNFKFVKNDVLYALMCSEYSPSMIDISRHIPRIDKPLILSSPTALSRKAQENTVEFLKQGGKLILLNTMPLLDENYNECTILKDFIDIEYEIYSEEKRGFQQRFKYLTVEGMESHIYCLEYNGCICDNTADTLGINTENDILVAQKNNVIFSPLKFKFTMFDHSDLIRNMIQRLSGEETVYHSNRHLFVSLFEGEQGQKMLFIMNPYSGKNITDIRVGEKEIKDITLAPMEVKTIIL